MAALKYRTASLACSCPGFWFRRTCKHYRAYREAVALVVAQDAVNTACHRYATTCPLSVFHRSWDCLRSRSLGFGLSTVLGMMAAPQGREGMIEDRLSLEDLLLATLDAVSRFRVGQRDTVGAALDAGAFLAQAKGRLQHGEWGRTGCIAWAWPHVQRVCG